MNGEVIIESKLDVEIFNIMQGLDLGLLEAGQEIVALASVLAPKDTGELSRSGKAEMTDPHTVEVSFGNDIQDLRAVIQEYGSIFQPAQPYLTPAIRTVDVEFFITSAIRSKLT